MWKSLRITMLVALLTPAVAAAQSPFGEPRLISPAGKCKLETVIPAGQMWLEYARCDAGPLPGRDSVIVELNAPAADAIYAAAIKPTDQHWSIPHWPKTMAQLPPLTQYVIWREGDRYGVAVNLTGGGMISYLESRRGKLVAVAHSRDSHYPPSYVPLFAVGRGDDPYRLTRDLYQFALANMNALDPMVRGKRRVDKPYPEIWNYVGWCSWNSYYHTVNAAGLYGNAASWQQAGFPMRWMIIDDGWETLVDNKAYKVNNRSLSLAGFEADPAKFPEGLGPAIGKLKNDYGITWVGMWNTLQGHWNGVDLDSPAGVQTKDGLMPINPAVGVPDPRGPNGLIFWDAFYASLKSAGVDFVKTDDQSTMYDFIEDQYPVGLAYANAQRNFQDAGEKYFGSNVLNCMSMNVDSIYHWDRTNIARASRDYYPNAWHNPRTHQVDAVMNAMWLENLAWPDYDMWETYNWHSAYNAVARAISGGPVYITDKEGKEKWEMVWPLVYGDGEAIRLDEPGRPCRKSLFVDPYSSGVPFMAFSRAGAAGVVAVWNMNRFELPEKGALAPEDVEGIAGDEFFVYEYFSRSGRLVKRGGSLPLKMKPWDARIYSVVPVMDGFAAVGLVNKYAAPAAVAEVKKEDGKVTVRLKEAGRFAAYSQARPKEIKVDGDALAESKIKFVDGCLELDLGAADRQSKEVVVELSW